MYFSKEGTWVIVPQTVGGASVIFYGCAAKPPQWLKDRYDIDLSAEVDELYKEIPIKPLPDHLIGEAARRIMEEAQGMGLDWKPIDKFMRPDKCKLGCGSFDVGYPAVGAKWTAREYVEEARANGAELLVKTKVDMVLIENGKAVGVRAKGPDGWQNIFADTVVLSAGGMGTPPILNRSGVFDAGKGFFADPLWLVSGISSTMKKGTNGCIPMTAGVNLEEDGILMTDIMQPLSFLLGATILKGPMGFPAIPKYVTNFNKIVTIMVKTRDHLVGGRVNSDGSFSKPIDYDNWWKLNKGQVIAEQILRKVGVKRENIMTTCVLAGHPGGTVRIGGLLDNNCQSPITNCYCMDTSIIPEDWGLPPVVTVVAMAKRLSKHLLGRKKS